MYFSLHEWICYSVLTAIVSWAALIDYKHHRIPNWLSFSGWIAGPVIHLCTSGASAFFGSLEGLALVLLITFPLFALNWMGAGDVKLLTSVGALVGVGNVSLFICSIVITGFILGIGQLALHGLLRKFAQRYRMMLLLSLTSGRPVYVAPDDSHSVTVMPYAIPTAIGTVAALIVLWL